MSQTQLPDFVTRQAVESKRFFLNLMPDFDSRLSIVCGGVEKLQPEYSIHREVFPYFGMECVSEGRGFLELDEVKYLLGPGSVFAYGPSSRVKIRNAPDDPMRKHYVDFVGVDSNTWLKEVGLMKVDERLTCVSIRGVHEVTELFEMLHRNGISGHRDPDQTQRFCVRILELMWLKIKELHLPDGKSATQSHATFEKLRRFLDDEYLTVTTIEQVAESFSMSAVHVSRLFARFAECGAYQYLQKRRMNYAAGLLMNEGLMVKEVAIMMGFADPFQFSRTFKRVYGVPPKELISRRQ